MTVRRQLTLVAIVATLCCALAYGIGWAGQQQILPWQHADGGPVDAAAQPHPAADRGAATAEAESRPAPTRRAAEKHRDRQVVQDTADIPTQEMMVPGPTLLGPGASGPRVRDLQARLAQIYWFNQDVTGVYGDATTAAVRGFQGKRAIPVTGEVDQRTLDRLYGMTRQPTHAELTNQPTTNTPGALDPRCTSGRVLCIDKTTSTLRWAVDGQVLTTVDVRFGSAYTPTREGVFSVYSKSRDHVSSLFDTAMPFAMFFSGGQAVHYSSDFAANGYTGASHGCVNVRDYDAVAWLFDQVQIGDTVVIYWS